MPRRIDLTEVDSLRVTQLSLPQLVEWTLLNQLAEQQRPDYRWPEYRTHMWPLACRVKEYAQRRQNNWTAERAWRSVNRIVSRRFGGWDHWSEIHGHLNDGHSFECVPLSVMDTDDLQMDFVNSWTAYKGLRNPLDYAASYATAYPLPIGDNHRSKGFQRFISLCGYLAAVTRDENVSLHQRRVAKVLGVNRNTVSGWVRNWAVPDGWLERTKRHRFFGPGAKGNRETVYRVADTLKEAAGRRIRSVPPLALGASLPRPFSER